jgi:DNA-binding SARP family transcriptional activator/Tfp pilus assembly protein PilF
MWFGVLGPLLVRDGESVIGVPAGRQRVLLAALLMRAGAVVSADALAEVVWDGTPPGGAGTTLRSHVSRLRQILGPAAGARVVTRYPGYLIEASEGEVDLLRFRRQYRDGAAAIRGGDWARAFETLAEALGLWRGEPLADVPSDVLRRDVVPGLEELRLQALEWRMDAGLQLGRHGELVPELQSLTGQFPLRERFAGQLMLALVRCGRQAEALEAYQRAREVLVDQLGAEPGTELRELHQRILSADPALSATATAAPASPEAGQGETIRPRELPAPVAGFVGRGDELAALTGLLDRSGEQGPSAIVISAIGGTAGVGKTALAVQWAHQIAGRFPDGQLYVNLRGYDPDRPMAAADALAGFLRALGVAGQDIPPEEDERAARYRSRLAGRRVLIVLDNAGSVEQVRPLLPGSPGCAVLVTSRDALAGLVARDGAARVELDLLPPGEAVGLLGELIGGRVGEDVAAAETIAGQCCRLPLALRVAAELAASRPDVPLADLADELADEQKRLDLLDVDGDPRTAVRAVFSWSYRHLDADAARAFRLAGLHPGPDFETYAVAALTGSDLERARAMLGTLDRAHMIQSTGPGRYGMHDLLRAYARELAADDGEEEQRAALTRLFDHYLHTSSIAIDVLYPAERHRRPRIPPPASPVPPVKGPVAARAWLDAERAALAAVTVYAAEHGWPGHATRLADTLWRYLFSGGHHPEAMIICDHVRRAAAATGDQAAEAVALTNLGLLHWLAGRSLQASRHFRQARGLFSRLGDRTGQARALHNLGLVELHQSRYQQAARLFQQALALFRTVGDRTGEARALGNLGVVDRRLGHYQQALEHQEQSLALCQELDDWDGAATALNRLGFISLTLGRYQQAEGYFRRALSLSRETGNRTHEADALKSLGGTYLQLARHHEAAEHYRQALDLFRRTGNRSGEAEALNGSGEVLLAIGEPAKARVQLQAALGLASELGFKHEQARACSGLGQACNALGDISRARDYWQQAVALFTELGVPEADQVRAQLAAAENDGDNDGDRERKLSQQGNHRSFS